MFIIITRLREEPVACDVNRIDTICVDDGDTLIKYTHTDGETERIYTKETIESLVQRINALKQGRS